MKYRVQPWTGNLCAKPGNKKTVTKTSVFPATAPLKTIAIDILNTLLTTRSGNQWIVVMTNRFSKLAREITTTKTTATTVATIFLEHWVSNFGLPVKNPTGNGPHYTCNCFENYMQTTWRKSKKDGWLLALSKWAGRAFWRINRL